MHPALIVKGDFLIIQPHVHDGKNLTIAEITNKDKYMKDQDERLYHCYVALQMKILIYAALEGVCTKFGNKLKQISET